MTTTMICLCSNRLSVHHIHKQQSYNIPFLPLIHIRRGTQNPYIPYTLSDYTSWKKINGNYFGVTEDYDTRWTSIIHVHINYTVIILQRFYKFSAAQTPKTGSAARTVAPGRPGATLRPMLNLEGNLPIQDRKFPSM
jgi:hypothetical protein